MRVVVAVTGASGSIYGVRALEVLHELGVETHLVISEAGELVIGHETGRTLVELQALATAVYSDGDLAALPASGSARLNAMAVVPCSSGTLAKIAFGVTDSLVTRAAAVMLKERRPLVVVPRETPLSRPMLRSWLEAFDAGAVVLPASPGFYSRPQTVPELVDFVVARVLDHLGVEHQLGRRWRGG